MIAKVNRPTLVLAHNKTLAAQLYQEFKAFFPRQRGRVLRLLLRLLPARGLHPAVGHLHREGSDDQRGDRPAAALRHAQPVRAARRDHRGLGLLHLRPRLARGLLRDAAVRAPGRRRSTGATCSRGWSRPTTTATTSSCERGTFRVRGDVVEIVPAYEESGIRIELFGDEVERISAFDPLTGKTTGRLAQVAIYPSSHYVTPQPRLDDAIKTIEAELLEVKPQLEAPGQAARGPAARPAHDVRPRDAARDRLLPRHRELLAPPLGPRGRASRRRRCSTTCPKDALMVVDESHQSRPAGARDVPRRPAAQEDAGRVRLPPALGPRQPAAELRGVRGARRARCSTSRPRPGPTSCRRPAGVVVEQVIRPTGLIDPRDRGAARSKGQVDDLLAEIRARAAKGRARAGHDADQAHGRGPDRVLPRPRRAGALPALRHRDARAGAHPARPAQGRVRRAGRHQPAARGARPARGVAGRDPRRRQGGLPALGGVADPDDRPRRAQRRRAGPSSTPTRSPTR